MNSLEYAYMLGRLHGMEKTSSMSLLKGGMNLIRSGGSKAMNWANRGFQIGKTPSKFNRNVNFYLHKGSKLDKGLRYVGRKTLGDGAFVSGGAINAYFTEGDWKDKAFAFGTGGLMTAGGLRAANRVGNRAGMAMGRTGFKQTHKVLQDMGVKNRRGITMAYKKMVDPKNFKDFAANKSAYKDLLKQNTTFGQRLRLNLQTNKRGIATTGLAFGTGLYLPYKAQTAATGLWNRMRRGPEDAPGLQQPPSLPYNNNPYS